jgi:hypothetical protein
VLRGRSSENDRVEWQSKQRRRCVVRRSLSVSAVSRFKQIMAKPLACDPKLLAPGIVLGRLTARFAQFMRQLIHFVPNRLLVHETGIDATVSGQDLAGAAWTHGSAHIAASQRRMRS